jgi:5-methylcytosine-specific restriction endonuclease McrA
MACYPTSEVGPTSCFMLNDLSTEKSMLTTQEIGSPHAGLASGEKNDRAGVDRAGAVTPDTQSLLSKWSKQQAAKKAWRERNKEHLRKYMREWKAKGGTAAERKREYRAQHKYGVTRGDLMGLLASQGGKCKLCGDGLHGKRHLDHMLPRSRGGKSEIANYQYLCPTCNMGKGALTTDEYLEHCRRVLLYNGKWYE